MVDKSDEYIKAVKLSDEDLETVKKLLSSPSSKISKSDIFYIILVDLETSDALEKFGIRSQNAKGQKGYYKVEPYFIDVVFGGNQKMEAFLDSVITEKSNVDKLKRSDDNIPLRLDNPK
ncbi:MAG: hypothetical protein WCJ33_06765, partial [Pseudomonadota bacterium]